MYRGRVEVISLARPGAEGEHAAGRAKKTIGLDLIAPEDEVILLDKGLRALRRARIRRLCIQAAEQGALLTYGDLVHLLSTSVSTLKRDVAALERDGFLAGIYRRRGRRPKALLCLAVLALLAPRPAEAQITSVFGSVGAGYQYQDQEAEGSDTTREALQEQFNLGIDGMVLDPRLAAFSFSSTFASFAFADENARARSFAGHLSLLQGKPYAVTLKHSRTAAVNQTDSDITSSGALVRLTPPHLPQLFLDFNRVKVESKGGSPADTTFTYGTARLSQRFRRASIEGEFGVQEFEDHLRGTTQDRSFARASSAVSLSPATTLRFVADEFSLADQSSVSSSLSVLSRPNTSVSRSASLGYRSRRSGDLETRSIDASGALSRSFSFPGAPWLSASASTSAFGIFADPVGNTLGWSGGGNAVITRFRPVLILGDYGLVLSHQDGQVDPSGVTHQVHLGVSSQSLSAARLSGDYFLNVQSATIDITQHFFGGRAEFAVKPNFQLRSSGSVLQEEIHSPTPVPVTFDQRTVTAGTGASYRRSASLAFDFSGNFHRRTTPTSSATTLQANASLTYLIPIPGRPSLSVIGLAERLSQGEQTRFEVRSRLNYVFGRLTVVVEHRFEELDHHGAAVRANSYTVSVLRPFSHAF